MFKHLAKQIGHVVEGQYGAAGAASNQLLQKAGFEQTGQFVEEQLVDIGQGTGETIAVTGQLADGTVKTIGGYVLRDEALKQAGVADLSDGAETVVATHIADTLDKVDDATTVGVGLATGDMAKVKDGATSLIGLKKSAVGVQLLDDVTQFTKRNR